MIDDFQHVCITCRDLERSIRFYEKLGLKVIRSITEFNDEGICASIQLPRGHLRVVQLAPPQATGKMFIDLVQWWELSSVGGVYPALNHILINRISFRVSDIDATAAALRHQGITFLSREPQTFGEAIRSIDAARSAENGFDISYFATRVLKVGAGTFLFQR
jgi:glyoxylase I family protein